MKPNRFSRALNALLGRSIGYEGAAPGRRWRGATEIPNLLTAAHQAREPLARRARGLVANNAAAAAGCEAWVSSLIGTGLRPQPTHPDPDWRKRAANAWEKWTDQADFEGLGDLYAQQALVAGRTVVDGECFVQLIHDDRDAALRLRVVEAHQIDGSLTRPLPDGGQIIAGIEFDAHGRRTAFHVLRKPPGILAGFDLSRIRVPAEDMLQIMRASFPGQPRGMSWFAPVLLRLRDADETRDAMILKAKLGAALAGFVYTADGTTAGMDETRVDGGIFEGGIEPLTVKVLDPGQQITFSEPARIGPEVVDFLSVTTKEIAAGLGVPASLISGDYGDANYSSLRAEKVAFQRRAETLQHHVFAYQLCRPVWRRFITTEILTGRLPAPGFERDPERYLGARWITPRDTWVDPQKDVEAEIAAIDAGLLSRRQAVEARGISVEELDAEIAADREREAALGLDFNRTPRPNAPEVAQ